VPALIYGYLSIDTAHSEEGARMQRLPSLARSPALLALAGLLAAGCGPRGPSVPDDAIVMTSTRFEPASRTIQRGGRVTFFNQQSGALHVLVNGRGGGTRREKGAASFGGVSGHRSKQGEIWTTPAWKTVGTFHVTCTIHPGMNLTVNVRGA
jgi:plastocyanin